MPTLTVVGSINADLAVHVQRHPHPGETLLGSGGSISPGGKGANQAVAAALQGAEVHFVGAVGDDAYAKPALELLARSGVNLEGVQRLEGSTGLAVITVAEDGENSIIVIPGANAKVDAAYVRSQAARISNADVLLLQGEIPPAAFAEAVSLAARRVVINLAPVIEVDTQALLQADPLMANEHEAGLILEQFGVAAEGSPEHLAQALLDLGFASVVLTLGAEGALVADAEGLSAIASPKVRAVDTTGAGDAFAGACCAALLQGESLRTAAEHAVRVAAYSVTGHGAQTSYPTKDQELPGACV
ncbi:ribokinase [Corynebacterium pelargi]|uniref:Ribokinase n=1 Tax=Corynebacterium pelargi TaxID=1471400 RepID=A0A410WAH7_9CORY|nr:ribokinase [Corynebacterium pelargi]QAU52957.1 Ribokinase [Corynebacterium pelargi]GGG75813.1 ribokinase [Corynebacterium pelargi]